MPALLTPLEVAAEPEAAAGRTASSQSRGIAGLQAHGGGAAKAFPTEFDRIIIDTPPILSVADSLAVSHLADAVVMVVRSGVARKKAVLRVRDLLQRANSNLVGVVFNCVNLQLESYYGCRAQSTARR